MPQVKPQKAPVELAYPGQGFKLFLANISAPTEFIEHAHNWVEMAVPFEGALGPASWQSATGRTITQTIRTGYTSVLPANLPHWGIWEQEAEVLVFYLDPKFLYCCVGDALVGDSVEVVEACTAEDPFLLNLALSIRAKVQSDICPCTTLYVESLATSLATHLLSQYRASDLRLRLSQVGFAPRELQQIIDYTHSNLVNALSIAEVAKIVQLSPSQFTRLFKRSLGRTYYQYVIECRVAKVQQLLVKTSLSLSEIAQQTGFFDQSHMTHAVRRIVGITPSAYRQTFELSLKEGDFLQDSPTYTSTKITSE